jgi:hypothetical protein
MFEERFDELHKMGFEVQIQWMDWFGIYDIENDQNVLTCNYEDIGVPYTKMVEECLDIFDDWYESSSRLPDNVSCEFIGDITKRVRRNMGIDKIL